MHVASGSYVIPADIISAMGEGNSMAGFKIAKDIFSRHNRNITKGMPYGATGLPYGASAPHKADGGGTGNASPYSGMYQFFNALKSEEGLKGIIDSVVNRAMHKNDNYLKDSYNNSPFMPASMAVDPSTLPYATRADGGATGTRSTPSPAPAPTVYHNDPAPTQGGGGNGHTDSYNANQAAAAHYAQMDNERYGDPIPANLQSYLPGGSNAQYGQQNKPVSGFMGGLGDAIIGHTNGYNSWFDRINGGGKGGSLFNPAPSGVAASAPSETATTGNQPSWASRHPGLVGAGLGIITGIGPFAGAGIGNLFKKADGGATSGVPIVAAGGEYVIPPEDVVRIGGGDLDYGHKVLDSFVKKMRQKTIKTLQGLPGPKKD
jgi:hypothetical protein